MPYVQKLADGQRWGRLKVESCKFVKRMMMHENGLTGKLYERLTTVMEYVIRCECGRSMRVLEHNLKPKRRMMDCGCGCADDDLGSTHLRINVPLSLARQVRVYAERENLKLSQALVKLCEDFEQPWDWRHWNGVDDLPDECTKQRIGYHEMKVAFCCTIPSAMKFWLNAVSKTFDTSARRVVIGLLAWRFAKDKEVKRRGIKEIVLELGEDDHLSGASEV